MEIGDEILIKVKVIDMDSNPHGPSIKVEVKGFGPLHSSVAPNDKEQFWIHRADTEEVIMGQLTPLMEPEGIAMCNCISCVPHIDVYRGCQFAEFEQKFEGKKFTGRGKCKKRQELSKQAKG